MKKITVSIKDEQKDFLGLIEHEDAATNQSTAVQWCIDSCMKIEERYKVDACFVGYNNIVLETLLNREKEGDTLYNVKFYDDKKLIQVYANNFPVAGFLATAYRILSGVGGWGIEWIESDRTHNKVPFEL